MRRFFVYLTCYFLTACCLSRTPAAAQDASVERDIVAYVDAHHDEAVALLERTVNINSGSMNFEGVRAVGQVFGGELEALGFETRWVDGAPFERAGHLVAERTGTGPRLLLIGHLDTVFEPDSPFQAFDLVNDSTAHGPGVADMKGGDVVIVQALAALRAAGVLEDMSITVVMTGDEELSGRPLDLARQALTEAADAAEVALGFENGDGNPATAVVARRGFTGWELRVTGTPAHSSQVFRDDVGAGAIYEASRILNRFYEDMTGEQYLTFNPGLILGGTTVDHDAAQDRGTAFGKSNVVAEHALVTGDLRTISAEQLERAKERMRAIVADHRPRTKAEITFRDTYPPMGASDGNMRLLGMFDQVSRDLGFGPVTAVDPGAAGAADVSFTAGRVAMAIDGLGLGGTEGHTVDETGHLWTLPLQAKRAAVLMYRLTRGEEN
jgi:glutamate carboxypeptidase